MKIRPSPAPRKRRQAPRRPGESADELLYIGQWISLLGKTQAEVARQAEVNEGYLSQLISGKYDKDPTLSTLKAIADALGVAPQALFVPPPPKEHLAAFRLIHEPRKPS